MIGGICGTVVPLCDFHSNVINGLIINKLHHFGGLSSESS